MAVDAGRIRAVELALGHGLYDWQKAYLMDEPTKIDIRMTGRKQGHTTAYILKLLLEDTEAEPINLTNQRAVVDIMDWWSYSDYHGRYKNVGYAKIFTDMLIDIKTALKEHNIQSRRIATYKGTTHYAGRTEVW